MIVCHGYALRVESICFDDVGSGFEILPVNVLNDVGARKAQKVVASLYVHVMPCKPFAAEVGLAEASALYHRAHGSVDNEYAVASCRYDGAAVEPVGRSLFVLSCKLLEFALGALYYSLHFFVGVALAAVYAYGVVLLLRLLGLVFLIFLNDAHGFLHLVLVVEVHLNMHSVASYVVEQRPQLVERYPACHYALASCQYLLVQVVPFWRASLRLSHARRPLYGVEFLYLEQRRQMMKSAHAVEMIQRVVDLLALFAYERLHKAAVVFHAYHGRYVALQLAHLARCPRREVAESHLVALAHYVVKLVEHLEVDVVYLLHLSFQHLRLRNRVHQHLVRALQSRQNVHAFHEVGHAHIIVAVGLLLAFCQQLLVQQPVGMLRIKLYVVGEVRVGVYPYRVFSALEHASEDSGERAGAQLCVCNRQHISLQTAVSHVPVEIFGTPFRVEPFLVEVLWGWRCRHIGMRLDAFLKVFPHVQNNALVVPPLYVSLFCFFKILFPHVQ